MLCWHYKRAMEVLHHQTVSRKVVPWSNPYKQKPPSLQPKNQVSRPVSRSDQINGRSFSWTNFSSQEHQCYKFLPASPKAKAGLGVQSLRPSVRPSVCPSVRPKILSSQLLWKYWSNYHETWYVDRTSYVVMHIGRKFWSPHFCWSYVPWNLENTHKWSCHRNSSETTDLIIMKLSM